MKADEKRGNCEWKKDRVYGQEMLNYVDKKCDLGLREGHRSEIKIQRTRTREIWESSKKLRTKHLYFLYIFNAFKMARFAFQKGPF